MMIRGVKPFHIPNRSFLAKSIAEAPFAAWFNFKTTTSAGWETMAQKTPAM
jgi:hypothetical protein